MKMLKCYIENITQKNNIVINIKLPVEKVANWRWIPEALPVVLRVRPILSLRSISLSVPDLFFTADTFTYVTPDAILTSP